MFLIISHEEIRELLKLSQLEKLMPALQDLTSAIADQTTAVSALTAAVLTAIPDINPTPGAGATEAQVAAAATAVAANTANVAAQTAAINAAVNATPSGIPVVPTSVVAKTSPATTVSLSFSASPGAASYNVKRSNTSGGPYSTVGSPTVATFTEGGLPVGVPVFYVVSAVNASGESENSAEVTATPVA